MDKKNTARGESLLPAAQTIFVVLFIALMLLSYYGGNIYYFLFRQFFFPASAVFAGMLLARPRMLRGNVEIKILFAYIAWLGLSIFGSTMLAGETMDIMYEQTTYVTLFAALVCYPLPFLFSGKEERRRMLSLALHVILGLYAAACALAVALVVMQTNIQPDHTYMMGINPGTGNRLCMFMHPNSVGALSNMAMLLAVYMALDAKRVAVRVYYVIAALLMYATIGLADSRTNMIAVALSMGLLLYLVAQRTFRREKTPVAVLAGVGIGAVGVVVAYLGFSVVNSVIEWGMVHTAAAEEAAILATESRALSTDLATFTGRDIIWRDALKAMFEHPLTLLFGTTRERVMTYMGHLPYIAGNLHNSLLQVLMATGIPGLGLVCGFLFFLIRECGLLFFRRKAGPTLAEQFLPVIVFSGLVFSLMEAILFLASGGAINMLFFLAAGMAVCAAREWRGKAV